MSYLEATNNLYKEAALTPDVGLCCTTNPIWELPGLKIPKIMQEMNYGCGSTVHARDLTNNPKMLYVGVGGGMELLQFSYFNRQKGGVIGIDVVELRSYHYHTGLMYAVYAPNRAAPLAQGGRYDGIGQHFGRARPATGFSCDLFVLSAGRFESSSVVVAPKGSQPDLIAAIQNTRAQGFSVIQLLGNDDLNSVPYATHQLVLANGEWTVEKI